MCLNRHVIVRFKELNSLRSNIRKKLLDLDLNVCAAMQSELMPCCFSIHTTSPVVFLLPTCTYIHFPAKKLMLSIFAFCYHFNTVHLRHVLYALHMWIQRGALPVPPLNTNLIRLGALLIRYFPGLQIWHYCLSFAGARTPLTSLQHSHGISSWN